MSRVHLRPERRSESDGSGFRKKEIKDFRQETGLLTSILQGLSLFLVRWSVFVSLYNFLDDSGLGISYTQVQTIT